MFFSFDLSLHGWSNFLFNCSFNLWISLLNMSLEFWINCCFNCSFTFHVIFIAFLFLILIQFLYMFSSYSISSYTSYLFSYLVSYLISHLMSYLAWLNGFLAKNCQFIFWRMGFLAQIFQCLAQRHSSSILLFFGPRAFQPKPFNMWLWLKGLLASNFWFIFWPMVLQPCKV